MVMPPFILDKFPFKTLVREVFSSAPSIRARVFGSDETAQRNDHNIWTATNTVKHPRRYVYVCDES